MKRQRNPILNILHYFNSIWLGISLIVLIFVYSAIGSAVPVFRQFFELTEFQFFNHPLFAILIGFFCLVLIITSLSRIKFTARTIGVWTVHTGLLVLCAGSVVYFGQKLEGDVWLDAPRIRVVSIDRLRSEAENPYLATFPAVKGETWQTEIPMLGGKYRAEVLDVKHEGLITAQKVTLAVSVGDESPRTIELVQADGAPPVSKINDRIGLWLYPATVAQSFFDESTPMLEVHVGSHMERFELPQLPYYAERFVSDVEEIRDLDGRVVPSDRATPIAFLEQWRMPIALNDEDRASHEDWPFDVSIDGYLPYARLDPRPIEGNGSLMPLIRAKLDADGLSRTDWLVAQAPDQSSLELENGGAWVEFAWINQQETIDPTWTQPLEGSHVLEVLVKDKNVRRIYDVRQGQNIEVEGTSYKLTIEELRPSWPLMSPGFQNARTPITLVWVDGPGQSYQRSVLDRFPRLNQDRDRAGKKISPTASLIDDNLELRYTDASRPRFKLVAGEKLSPTMIYTAPGGKRTMQRLEKGRDFESDGARLTLADYVQRPEFVMEPLVVPRQFRRNLSSVRRGESMVRVHLKARDGSWSRRIWVPFSPYNTIHDGMQPTVMRQVAGVGDIQFIYGRTPRALPSRLTLERLQTDYYPGRQQASMWTSYIREEDPETGVVLRKKAWLNNTARVGPWTLFQSQAPSDGKSWTVLGVGNRQGVWTMLWGCTLITLGMIYAFCVKPILLKRRRSSINPPRDSSPAGDHEAHRTLPPRSRQTAAIGATVLALLTFSGISRQADAQEHFPAVADLQTLQEKIDVPRLGRLALQHSWRYATVDSWARDAVKSIHGSKKLWGLDPVVAAMEIMFNAPAHHGEPVIFIKDAALRRELTAHPVSLSNAERERIQRTGMVSHDFISSPPVAMRIKQLAGDMLRKTAMDRLETAINYYQMLGFTFTVVPHPQGATDTPWYPLSSVNPVSGVRLEGLTEDQIRAVGEVWQRLRMAWVARNADGINVSIGDLEKLLPSLAPAGVYPSEESRTKEVTYRRMNLMRWAWVIYIAAFFISIFAVATGYRWVRTFGLIVLVAAIGLHGYDIALRWQVIGRIPVANMYEAVTSSTWIGAVFGLLLELFMRKRVFLLGSALLGFFALALPELLPDQVDNKLTTMMPILDDIMLRIHTVLIISSYAVITLAYGVANCYLFVSALRDRVSLAQGVIGAQIGAITVLLLTKYDLVQTQHASWYVLTMASAVVGGALVAVGLASLLPTPRIVPIGRAAAVEPGDFPVARGVLEEFDLSHRVLLYTATISLFVGLVLGAVWADYSWGRPWGWDPKEVFALCTWLIYAILIHAKFVTRRGALWTSVLSVIGFAVMQFNWWVVNFYIVGLHSYA